MLSPKKVITHCPDPRAIASQLTLSAHERGINNASSVHLYPPYITILIAINYRELSLSTRTESKIDIFLFFFSLNKVRKKIKKEKPLEKKGEKKN